MDTQYDDAMEGAEGQMSTDGAKADDDDVLVEQLRLARVDAYVRFSSAAWAALEIRHKHGTNSPEYTTARARTDEARTAFATASNAYRGHIAPPHG